MKKRIIHVLCAIALSSGLLSCEKEIVVMSDAGTTFKTKQDTILTVSTVSFSKDVQPILTANCVRCHNSGSHFSCAPADAYSTLVNGKYVNTTDPENSKFFVNALQGHPDDYLLPAEHSLIAKWMKEGAKNN